jgi:upstream activation factor subunit UAF30
MPRISSKKSTETETVAPVVAAKAAAAPKVAAAAPKAVAAAAAPKAEKKTKAAATPAAAPVVAAVAAPAVATEAADAQAEAQPLSEAALSAAFADLFGKLQQVTTMLSSLKTEFRQLEKRASRELKVANKASAKRRRKSGNRSPSGFVKPTLISPELASFLGKAAGTEMARTEVTREINAYIRKHNLQDKENGRKINPDAHLSKLLKLNDADELTYFNLQRYMSPHFAKATKGAETA